MGIKVLRDCTLVLSYDMLSDEAKLLKRNQRFNFIQEDNTTDELLDISTSIQTVLSSAVKEVRQDLSYLIVEA
ncbi:MAG: hypothetical protein FWC47_01670 [Oscillospiraceae bacterium]|nr:hypothetical protein [Oscillospiraceae bacterium]